MWEGPIFFWIGRVSLFVSPPSPPERGTHVDWVCTKGEWYWERHSRLRGWDIDGNNKEPGTLPFSFLAYACLSSLTMSFIRQALSEFASFLEALSVLCWLSIRGCSHGAAFLGGFAWVS